MKRNNAPTGHLPALLSKTLPLLLALAVLILSSGCASIIPRKNKQKAEITVPNPYNVLFVTYESMNTKHMMAYGNEVETSPFSLDFSKKGALFKQCYGSSGWTSENVASLFTGTSSLMHGLYSRNHHVPAAWYTPFEMLRDGGYQIPRMQGFQADMNYNQLGFTTGVSPVPGPEIVAKKDRGPKDILQPLIWLENHGEKPFFLWFHILNTHLPYNPEGWIKNKYFKEEMIPNEESRKRVDYVRNNGVVVWGSVEFKPEEDAEAIRALYDGELYRADKLFSILNFKLRELGIEKNTIVVLSADHGEELLEHGFIGHASTAKRANLHDENVHIPLMISLPGVIPQRVVINEQVRSVDIMPTIFDLMGLDIPEYMQGKSLMPMINAPEEAKERDVIISTSYAGFKEDDPKNITHFMRAVRKDQWKLIIDDNKGVISHQLYHLKDDPGEHSDIAAQHPEKVAELQQRYDEWLADSEARKEIAKRKEYTDPSFRRTALQKFFGRFKLPPRPIPEDTPNPPQVIKPTEGELLTAASTGGMVHIAWTGKEKVPYLLEVELGEGDYNFSVFLKAKGPELQRQFSESYWNTYVADYDPARVRVKIDRPEFEWSSWRNVRLQ